MTLPVRILETTGQLRLFQKEDFQLLINKTEREIIHFEYRKKSIGNIPELQRHFILSFQIPEYKNNVKKRISYIITEILNPGDNLILVSPLKIYHFKTPRNKENLFQKCNTVLTQDLKKYLLAQKSARKSLINKLKKLKSIYRRPEIFQGPFIETINFLNNYPPEFNKFKDQYLLPDPLIYKKVNNILKLKEGQRWWIHFHDHETYDIFFQTQDIVNDINHYITSTLWGFQALRKTITSKLNQLKQHLFLAKSFPQNQISDSLLRGNVSFSILLFSQVGDVPSHTSIVVISNLEKLLKKITRISGGITLNASEPAQEIKLIRNHVDHYYDMDFYFNGKIEDKIIELILRNKAEIRISYPNKFNTQELQTLIELPSREKVTITNFSNLKNQLKFDVHSFKLDSTQEGSPRFGLLKILISLANHENDIVYKSKKILRASKEKLEIVLQLPSKLEGRYQLNIRVIDLLANRQARFSQRIYLKYHL